MYKNFRVQNFRGFKDLQLNDLARVNLIAGKNSVGKTSILEALYIFSNPYNAELPVKINTFRGLRNIRINRSDLLDTSLDSLFYKFNPSTEILFEGKDGDKNDFKFVLRIPVDIEVQESSTVLDSSGTYETASVDAIPRQPLEIVDIDGHVERAYIGIEGESIRFFNPNIHPRHPNYYFSATIREAPDKVAERYSNMVTANREKQLLDVLQAVDPRIKSLRLLYRAGEPLIAANIEEGMPPIPLIFMGDGIVRLLQIVTVIGNAQDGVILIDEIENGLHYSVQTDVWQAIAKAAEIFNVQIFATTHSLEMIRAAHEAFKDTGKDDFRFYRLDRNAEDEIEAVTYTARIMEASIQNDYEVRG